MARISGKEPFNEPRPYKEYNPDRMWSEIASFAL